MKDKTLLLCLSGALRNSELTVAMPHAGPDTSGGACSDYCCPADYECQLDTNSFPDDFIYYCCAPPVLQTVCLSLSCAGYFILSKPLSSECITVSYDHAPLDLQLPDDLSC